MLASESAVRSEETVETTCAKCDTWMPHSLMDAFTLKGFVANGVTVVVPPIMLQTSSAGSGPGPVAAPQ